MRLRMMDEGQDLQVDDTHTRCGHGSSTKYDIMSLLSCYLTAMIRVFITRHLTMDYHHTARFPRR